MMKNIISQMTTLLLHQYPFHGIFNKKIAKRLLRALDI